MKILLLMSVFCSLLIGVSRFQPAQAIQSIESVKEEFYSGKITRSEVYIYCYKYYGENDVEWYECIQYFGLEF